MSLGFNYQALFEIIKKCPSCTCLASRFPYYSPITQDKLKMGNLNKQLEGKEN